MIGRKCALVSEFGKKVVRVPNAVFRMLASGVARPYSQLYIIGDGAQWVLSWEARELLNVAHRIGIPARLTRGSSAGIRRQCLFFCSQFVVSGLPNSIFRNRVGFAYFHGKPRPGYPEFIRVFEALRESHPRIWRVQVSHMEMHDLILETGIEQSKVHLIPIGINLEYFRLQTAESRRAAREKHGIPHSAVVVGSFQKDGNGWGEGLTPKLIKGPDVFLDVLKILKPKVNELFVLLSGPARGYVKKGLTELSIPFKHIYLRDYPQVGELYQAIDLYLVTSREEGGPRAVLESMASGVPLVTTRVGQAMDLVKHGENGWIAEVEDIEALAYWVVWVLQYQSSLGSVIGAAQATAEQNSYIAQDPLWQKFFDGFVTS